MGKIQIEIDDKYRESIDLLKQIIPNADGTQIKDDGRIIEILIESFMSFIQSPEMGGECGEDCECGGGECEHSGDEDHECGCK